MLTDTLAKKQAVLKHGGRIDIADKYVEPTILTDVSFDSPLMTDEIFGPLLPVFKYTDINEVTSYISSGEKPLTMYIFGKDRKVIDRICQECQSGSVVVNDTMYQYGNRHAPFGGVGNSGMGSYFGEYSFHDFSQQRTILRRDDHMILDIPIRYPPYLPIAVPIFKAVMQLPPIPAITRKSLVRFSVAAAVVAMISWVYVDGVDVTNGREVGLWICKNCRYIFG